MQCRALLTTSSHLDFTYSVLSASMASRGWLPTACRMGCIAQALCYSAAIVAMVVSHLFETAGRSRLRNDDTRKVRTKESCGGGYSRKSR